MNDPFQTPGAFSWVELTTTDPQAAQAFYAQVFGWTFEPMSMGEGPPYQVIQAGGSGIGGIMAPPAGAPAQMPPAWSAYVTVADIDATAAMVAELGGKVLVAPMEIPTVGRMAVFQDPQGAMISAIAYFPQT